MKYLIGHGKGTDLAVFAHRQRVLRRLPYKKAMMCVAQKLSRIMYQVLLIIESEVPEFTLYGKTQV